jgi:hypothetical protein
MLKGLSNIILPNRANSKLTDSFGLNAGGFNSGAGAGNIITAIIRPALAPIADGGTVEDALSANVDQTSNYASTAGDIASVVVEVLVNGEVPPALDTPLDFEDVVSLSVTVTDDAANVRVFTASRVVAGIAPTNDVAPSIAGDTGLGDVLTVTAGTWSGVPAPTLSYQWRRDGEAIAGETGSTYTITLADSGADIDVLETATNVEGSASEASNAITVDVFAVPDAFTAPDWGLSNDDGDISVNILTLPDDGGAPITDLEYRVNGGAAISLGETTTGSYPVTAVEGDDIQIRAVNAIGAGDWSDVKAVPAASALPLFFEVGADFWPAYKSEYMDVIVDEPDLTVASRDALGATLTDTNKWVGGVLGPDGKIYGMPHNSTDILIIDPVAGTATRSNMGATLTDTGKWVGGVLGPDGKIYGMPYNSTDILIIDPVAGTATRSNMGATLTDTIKWIGGVLGPDGKIYGMPFNSTDILIIDPVAGTATRSNMGATLTGTIKWYGGVLGPDGKIYGMPVNSADILIIDPVAGTATRSNMGATLTGTIKWYGGVLGPDGKIYGMPFNSTDILIIDPVAGTATRSNMGATLTDTNKWIGGVLGPDGKIYGMPVNSADILIIDPVAGTATRSNMGATLTDTGKWNGGVLGPDGKIYGMPVNSTDILIIDDGTPGELEALMSGWINKF